MSYSLSKEGECIPDVMMEMRVQERCVLYKPYELYEKGRAEDDYEERVYELVRKLTNSTASD